METYNMQNDEYRESQRRCHVDLSGFTLYEYDDYGLHEIQTSC